MGQTPLDIATMQDRVDILDFLLTESVRDMKNSVKEYMQRPTFNATSRGQDKIVLCLIKHGADLNNIVNNQTLLCIAAQRRHIKIVFHLLKHGADPNVRIGGRLNALTFAVLGQDTEIIRLLLRHNVEIYDLDDNDNTLLIKAILEGKEEIVEILLEHGVNVNHRNKDGASAMHFAALTGKIELINLLLKYKADVNIKNKRGGTPLHVAAFYKRKKAVEILIRNGADCNVVANGLVPLKCMKLPIDETEFNILQVPTITINTDFKFERGNAYDSSTNIKN